MSRILILAGHGGWEEGSGSFTVPSGISVHFFCEHGRPSYDKSAINQTIKENGGANKRDGMMAALMRHVKQTIVSGEQCYDYTLSAPTAGASKVTVLNKVKTVKQVRNSQELSLAEQVQEAAHKGIEDLVFYACRSMNKQDTQMWAPFTANEYLFIKGKYGGNPPMNMATIQQDMLMAGL